MKHRNDATLDTIQVRPAARTMGGSGLKFRTVDRIALLEGSQGIVCTVHNPARLCQFWTNARGTSALISELSGRTLVMSLQQGEQIECPLRAASAPIEGHPHPLDPNPLLAWLGANSNVEAQQLQIAECTSCVPDDERQGWRQGPLIEACYNGKCERQPLWLLHCKNDVLRSVIINSAWYKEPHFDTLKRTLPTALEGFAM